VPLAANVVLPLLERAGYGAAVCTVDGTVVARNEPAAHMLATIASLEPADDQREGARLPPLLTQALRAYDPEPVFLSIPGTRRIAAQTVARPAGQDATFLLILTDLNVRPGPSANTLRSAFGLTRREARVASALATGMRLQDVAAAHGVGMGTVRSQLKSIFMKTGTNRQSELVALLARLLLFS
jgi:DNA-binding CsgD family transcriptional regulator